MTIIIIITAQHSPARYSCDYGSYPHHLPYSNNILTVRYGTYHYHYSTSEERERHRSSTIEGSIRLIQHTTRTRYRGSKTRRHETDLTGVTGRQIRHLLHRRQQSLATRRFDPSNKRNANRLDRGDYSAHSERLSTIQLERDRETVGYSIQYPTATRER